MTDFYSTLGVSENASADEIKKAYRKLANQHHPDKGGDQNKFKDISVAYDTLSDPQKKEQYDNQRRYGGGPEVRFNSGDFQHFHDIFGDQFDPFGRRSNPFGDIFGRQMRKNKDLNIACQITLLDSFNGKQLEATYRMPSGKPQTVVIDVPQGISHGETIRYQGLGDDSMPGIPRGNLNVTIMIMPDPEFTRQGDDLYTILNISPIEAMIGCTKQVKLITGETKMIDIRAGIDSGAEFAQTGGGFSNLHTRQKGRFVTVVKIKTPAITDPELVDQLKELNSKIKQPK